MSKREKIRTGPQKQQQQPSEKANEYGTIISLSK
jgi:hypothetical protein